jgi:hypothetical protein
MAARRDGASHVNEDTSVFPSVGAGARTSESARGRSLRRQELRATFDSQSVYEFSDHCRITHRHACITTTPRSHLKFSKDHPLVGFK